MKLRVAVPAKTPTLRIGPANLIALIVSAILVLLALGVALRMNATAHELRADSDQLRMTRDQVQRWQTIAPTILHNESRARAALHPYCGMVADLNGTLLRIASRLNTPGSHVFVSAGNYLVSPKAAQPLAPPSPLPVPSPNAPSSPQPSATPMPPALVRDQNAPVAGDGYLEIQKQLTVEGPYPGVIRALLSVDALNYPLTINPPRVSRKGDRDVTFATSLTLRVPSRDLCGPSFTNQPASHIQRGTTMQHFNGRAGS